MSVTIGTTTFDRGSYDRGADVLYLSVGDPSTTARFEESAEGHALRYDDEGRLCRDHDRERTRSPRARRRHQRDAPAATSRA
jgi:YD repeat-containing protein